MTNKRPATPRSNSTLLVTAALALLAALLVIELWWELPLNGFFALSHSVERIEDWLHSLGAWAVAGSIALMVMHSFLPFPAEIIALANGMVFGPVWGALITWVGAMLGATAAFALVRALGQPFLHRFLSAKHMQQLGRWSQHQGAPTLLVARLIPAIAFNLVNYAAALSLVSWWTFLWTTSLGILPLTVLLAVMGDRMLSLPGWVWLLLSAAALLLWLASRRFRASRAAADRQGDITHPDP